MGSSQLSILLLVLAAAQVLLALGVTPGSPCAGYCVNPPDTLHPHAPSTNPDDIACNDAEFSSTTLGKGFKTCMQCLQQSTFVNGTESDVKWFTYNLRYTLSSCLFSKPRPPTGEKVDSTCVDNGACKSLSAPLTDGGLKANASNTWDYCTANDSSFKGKQLDTCISCLQDNDGQIYLSNFLIALESGCDQTPQDGQALGINGTVFSTTAVKVSDPDDGSSAGSASNGTAAASDAQGDSSSNTSSPALSKNAIIGIAVGAGALLLAALALLIIYWRRQKSYNRSRGWRIQSVSANQDDFLPPEDKVMSQSLRFHHGDAIAAHAAAAATTHAAASDQAPPYMSSGEYYDKIERDMRTGRLNYAFDPRTANRNPGCALPTHQAYNPRSMSRTDVRATSQRGPSPPNTGSFYRNAKPVTPDSFALQSYLASDGTVRSNVRAPPPAHITTSPEPRAGFRQLPPPPRGNAPPAVPELVLPSVPRVRMPKKYIPPTLTLQEASPVEASGPRPGMEISEPVMENESRFTDRPLGGPVVYATEQPQSHVQRPSMDYYEMPIQSGKTRLYS